MSRLGGLFLGYGEGICVGGESSSVRIESLGSARGVSTTSESATRASAYYRRSVKTKRRRQNRYVCLVNKNRHNT